MRVGFLGAGRMATALAGGLIRSGHSPASDLLASDVVEAACGAFRESTGAATASSADVIRKSEVLFLCTKPQQIVELLRDQAGAITDKHLIISIAAGVPLAKLEAAIPGRRVVRVMPNTPSLVGAGAAAFARGSAATAADATLVQQMLATVGLAVEVPEKLLDAVTGLSGSGPAYAFEIIEALSDGGVLAGLPRDVATKLAAQTMLGAAKMVLETGTHPGALKDAVTSPGGTTIAGLHELEKAGVRGSLMSAVRAATDRSRELGQ